jgi:hypothetical protein
MATWEYWLYPKKKWLSMSFLLHFQKMLTWLAENYTLFIKLLLFFVKIYIFSNVIDPCSFKVSDLSFQFSWKYRYKLYTLVPVPIWVFFFNYTIRIFLFFLITDNKRLQQQKITQGNMMPLFHSKSFIMVIWNDNITFISASFVIYLT